MDQELEARLNKLEKLIKETESEASDKGHALIIILLIIILLIVA